MTIHLKLVHSRESVPEDFTQPFLTQEQINSLRKLEDAFGKYSGAPFYD